MAEVTIGDIIAAWNALPKVKPESVYVARDVWAKLLDEWRPASRYGDPVPPPETFLGMSIVVCDWMAPGEWRLVPALPRIGLVPEPPGRGE